MLDFGRNEWRTARKSHKCYLCDKEIQKGERYFYADGKADGVFFHNHYHESCEEILRLYFRAHSGDDEWDHCWVTDWLEEYCQDNCEQFGRCGRSVFECEKNQKNNKRSYKWLKKLPNTIRNATFVIRNLK